MCILDAVFNIYVPQHYIRLLKGNLAPALQSTPDINIDTKNFHDSNTNPNNSSEVCTVGRKSENHALARDPGTVILDLFYILHGFT